MPQSLTAIYLHLVFSTKGRRRWFQNAEVRDRLHAYLGRIAKNLGCDPIRVGGVEDHVHVLTRLARDQTVANLVKELKRVSNLWLKETDPQFQAFAWQNGYACFSVSQSKLTKVTEYVARQEEHHHRLGFEDELRALLEKHNLEYDERYLWD